MFRVLGSILAATPCRTFSKPDIPHRKSPSSTLEVDSSLDNDAGQARDHVEEYDFGTRGPLCSTDSIVSILRCPPLHM